MKRVLSYSVLTLMILTVVPALSQAMNRGGVELNEKESEVSTPKTDPEASIESKELTCETSQDPTTRTPCPFLNSVIGKELSGRESVTVDELVTAAKARGVDEALMRTLANARAEKGTKVVILKKLLDRNLFPAHRGALARKDVNLAQVDPDRLAKLKETYSKDGRISFAQLKAYQTYCWSLSDMRFRDRLPARAEVKLLWDLFGAYRDSSDDTLDVDLVHTFLKDNRLPEPFKVNTVDPSSRSGVLLSVIYQWWKY